MSAVACTPDEHEHAKRPSQFPKLTYVGIWELGSVRLELRNCACGSTLARRLDPEIPR